MSSAGFLLHNRLVSPALRVAAQGAGLEGTLEHIPRGPRTRPGASWRLDNHARGPAGGRHPVVRGRMEPIGDLLWHDRGPVDKRRPHEHSQREKGLTPQNPAVET